MSAKKLIQILIGAIGFIVETIALNAEKNEIVIRLHLTKNERCRCGICRRKATPYDKGRGLRRWRCHDLGSMPVYIECEAPRVYCKKHGVVVTAVPWARHGSWFARAFEQEVAWLSLHLSKNAIAEYMRIEWSTVGSICRRVYEELAGKMPRRFSGLVNIGIDETSYRKGHKYMTVVINHDTGNVVWCGIGHGKAVLSQFFELLSEEERASIRLVSADGARWIAACLDEYCPNAQRCIDPFHVVSWATEILDRMRREFIKSEAQKTEPKPKRKVGRPRKDEQAATTEKRQPAKSVKNSRFALLKNPENLTDGQRAQLEFLADANPKLYRAYLLKENLRLALKAPADEIADVLEKWMGWAQRCRLPLFRELRKKIKRHFAAIIATAKYGLSNARMEAVNNKIKLIIRRSYGFRNMDNMLAMVMLSCSSVTITLPGR